MFKVFWWSVYTLKTISFVLDRLTDINMESKRLRTVQVKVSCPICGKSFSRSDNMKRHRQTHKHPSIGSQSKACPICDKVFSTSNNLKKHLQNHKEEEEEEGDLLDGDSGESTEGEGYEDEEVEWEELHIPSYNPGQNAWATLS